MILISVFFTVIIDYPGPGTGYCTVLYSVTDSLTVLVYSTVSLTVQY